MPIRRCSPIVLFLILTFGWTSSAAQSSQMDGDHSSPNISVDYEMVARIREERVRQNLGDAVRTAVAKTGRVVSSCGLIMAAAFASMMAGSLLVMKEFAVALALGILIDTFLVRPLLVPAAILLTARWFGPSAPAGAVKQTANDVDRH